MLDFLRKLLGQRILNYYHLAAAVVANFIYGFPSKKLHVIGVTGTDGKTTTVNMIASVLRSGGLSVSHLSTINAQIGDEIFDTGLHTTTPSSFLLQKLLAQMVRARSEYAVVEVTSHALDQHRTWGIDFETAVITNVTHEHLDYHKTYEEYVAAKARLFRGAENKVLNADDKSYEFLPSDKALAYGLGGSAQVRAENIREELTGTDFDAATPQGRFPVTLHLPGRFNVYNALAAVSVGLIYEISVENLQKGLIGVGGIKGRLETVSSNVMVDFAHTPNALERLLEFLRPKISGQLILVFGSAGERDKSKRLLMGQVADKFADKIILTREDNRSERVEDICREISEGIKSKEFKIIPDRREAIKAALRLAQGSNDLVVITGKGHEQSLNIDGRETPWDDKKIILEELAKS